ncbi:bile acid:sodium symporter [Altererythrobacter sp. B11]|uniref:bile acid:sodium symporter n=1 Tax=Altererythrobacter sp. B11 TaxID=2060312 RepID=UPI000DC6DD78|nr:bile acid:sodium symporter [Altererythrobacter sp. B11]BBC73818.1 bile acid:sodium symporter [Altererythrobacter sp. B11]
MKLPFSLDPFLIVLVAVVGGASLVPARGVAADWVGMAADVAIALLFFLHGAKLSRASILRGMGNLRLHSLVLASTYLVFPALGLFAVWLLAGRADPLLLSGVLYLTLLPSTVQSSIAFTAIAGGNVAAAVCSASLSNLIGIVLTPLLVGALMAVSGEGAVSTADAAKAIALQLLAPFLAGHFLRPLIGSFVDQHKAMLGKVDRGSILLVVYSAFSAAVVEGLWTRVGWSDLGLLLVISAVILALVMGVNALAARLFGLPREDAIVLLFCGSKKSLASGVPMAGALFAPVQVGMIVLPLMIFHQLQLFVCAILAARFRREAETQAAAAVPPAIPSTEAEVTEVAGALGLPVPASCMPGVLANMALLQRHADTLLAPPETSRP